jgi:hypothetical protein
LIPWSIAGNVAVVLDVDEAEVLRASEDDDGFDVDRRSI